MSLFVFYLLLKYYYNLITFSAYVDSDYIFEIPQ